MASIYQRNDGRWVAQYVTATGKAKYIYATKRKDVKAKLEKVLEAQAVGLLEDTEKLTVGQHLSDWLTATKSTVSESSYSLRVLYARKHISPALGYIKLRELNALHVQSFYQEKHAAGMLPQTVKRMHATLSKDITYSATCRTTGANLAVSHGQFRPHPHLQSVGCDVQLRASTRQHPPHSDGYDCYNDYGYQYFTHVLIMRRSLLE